MVMRSTLNINIHAWWDVQHFVSYLRKPRKQAVAYKEPFIIASLTIVISISTMNVSFFIGLLRDVLSLSSTASTKGAIVGDGRPDRELKCAQPMHSQL